MAMNKQRLKSPMFSTLVTHLTEILFENRLIIAIQNFYFCNYYCHQLIFETVFETSLNG